MSTNETTTVFMKLALEGGAEGVRAVMAVVELPATRAQPQVPTLRNSRAKPQSRQRFC